MRAEARRGAVFYIAMVVVAVLGIVVYAMHMRMQSENARIHRAYYSTAAIKLAEACEAEAFAWLAAQFELPYDLQDPFLQQLFTRPTEEFSIPTGEEPPSPDGRYLNLLDSNALLNGKALGEGLQGRATILRATLCFKDLKPLQIPDESVLEPTRQARVAIDPLERFGTIEFETEVAYGKVMRGALQGQDLVKRYISRRDVKMVNLLAPVVSRFTLFARGFVGPSGMDEPFNVDYPPGLPEEREGRAWLGVSDLSEAQPLVLIHHPTDIKERLGFALNHEDIARYLPFEPPFDDLTLDDPVLEDSVSYRPDVRDRGWVYLGGERPWILNLQTGRANIEPPELDDPADLAPFMTGEGHLLHESYLTVSDGEINGVPGASSWDPDLTGVHGWRWALWASGMPGAALEESLYWKEGVFANYYAVPAHAAESRRGSLLRLSGDIQSFDVDAQGRPSRYLDRRSPTLVLGPVLRRSMIVGRLGQMTGEDKATVDAGTFPDASDGSSVFPYPSAKAGGPRRAVLPYFDLDASGPTSAPQIHSWAGFWSWDEGFPAPDLNRVEESTVTGPATVDFSRFDWNITSKPMRSSGSPPWPLVRLLMSRIQTEPYNNGYDWITENARPVGLAPTRHLKQDHIGVIGPSTGSVSDRRLFYGTTKPSTDLVYFGKSLRFGQFDPAATPPGRAGADTAFPDGFFDGTLNALKISDESLAAPDPTTSGSISSERFDLRMKATYSFADADEWMSTQVDENGYIIASPGITVLREGGLDLTAYPEVSFDGGGMLICDGTVRLPRVIKGEGARETGAVLTFVSLKGDIAIEGDLVEAGLIALGDGRTLTRTQDYLTVRGYVAVDVLDFRTTGDGLFAGRKSPVSGLQPSGLSGLESYPRIVIEYDPNHNMANMATYNRRYRAYMAGGIAFWGVTE